jgi:hypothetical protein
MPKRKNANLQKQITQELIDKTLKEINIREQK